MAVNAAIATLISQKAISFNPKGGKLIVVDPGFQTDIPIEQAVMGIAGLTSGGTVKSARISCFPMVSAMRANLESKGMILTSGRGALVSFASFLIAIVAPIYGVLKINIGVERERPVGFLIVLCIVSTIMALFLLKRPLRTRYGDRQLEAMRKSSVYLKSVGYNHTNATGADVAMGVALFGLAAMAGSAYATDLRRLAPQPGSSSCSGGGCSGSSSSCSSGGGDGGGGGGCGGGCGGCGG